MKYNIQKFIVIIFTFTFAIGLIAFMINRNTHHKQKTLETNNTESNTCWQDTTPWYDSAFVYNVSNYRVDVLYSNRNNEIRLVFRNINEPDMFNVHITPITPDFETYKGDIFARFIDVHETNKCRAYEYYTEYRNGQKVHVKTHNQDVPLIDEFNVRLVQRQNPSTGTMVTYIIRNKKYERESTTWEMKL